MCQRKKMHYFRVHTNQAAVTSLLTDLHHHYFLCVSIRFYSTSFSLAVVDIVWTGSGYAIRIQSQYITAINIYWTQLKHLGLWRGLYLVLLSSRNNAMFSSRNINVSLKIQHILTEQFDWDQVTMFCPVEMTRNKYNCHCQAWEFLCAHSSQLESRVLRMSGPHLWKCHRLSSHYDVSEK